MSNQETFKSNIHNYYNNPEMKITHPNEDEREMKITPPKNIYIELSKRVSRKEINELELNRMPGFSVTWNWNISGIYEEKYNRVEENDDDSVFSRNSFILMNIKILIFRNLYK